MRTIWRTIGGLILGGALLLPAAKAATGFGDSPVFAVNLLNQAGGLSVNGTVLDGNTGNGLVGALVQLGTSSTVSGSGGAYSISSVAVGDYTLTGSKSGYNNASYSVTVSAGSSLSRLVVLLPTSAPGSLPTVTSVKSKYPDSSYYLDGVLFSVSFTANVDWAGHPAGTVQFITPRKTYTVAASGSAVSQMLAMGSDFGPGGHLQVVAVSSDSATSSHKLAGFTVMPNPFPGPLGLAWGVEDDGGDFNYSETTTSPQSFIDAGVGNGIIPQDIPLFGGKGMNLGFLPEVSFKATSSGQMQISMAWSDLEAGNLLNETWKNGQITDLTDKLNNFINAGTISAMEVPHAGFGDLNLSFYPILGGGWQYNSDLGQWNWRDAELGIAGEFSIQQTWPFAAGPVPMFVKVKFDLSAQLTAQLLNSDPVSLNGEFNLAPSLRGSLGVGISEFASAEGWLEGGLSLDLQYPGTPTVKDATVYVNAGATVYFLLIPKEWSMPLKSWDLNGGSLAVPQVLLMQQSARSQALGRGYLNYPSTGVMGRSLAKPMFFGAGSGGANPEILMSPVIPFCDPNCSSSGTNCYLVFLEDNTNRTSMNRTMAMFSKYDGNMWSAPVALADDGTADFHPRVLAFSDGSAVAAWENEGTLQPDTAGLTDMETNLEVSVAWYNTSSKTWQPALQMTTNSFLDRSPKLAGRSPNNVLLTWVSNPANDVNGSSTSPNQIWSAQWNGSTWSAPQLAAIVSNALVKYDLAYDGTNANLVISLDTVDYSTNANGHELFRITYQGGVWGAPGQLTSDQAPDDNPQMSFDPQGSTVLTWLKGSELSSVLNFNMTSRSVVRTNDYSSNLADFKLASSGDGKLALLWSEPSENDADLFVMFYDPIFQTWGSPRQLTHDPQAERHTTAAFYGTNEVIAVYNRSMVSSTNSVNTTLTDLAAYYYTLGEDLALDGSQFNANPANPTPGSTATLTVEVLNLGDKVETNVVVAFYLGATQPASEIGRVTLTNAIPPQGSSFVTFNWQVPSTNSPVTVFAVADPDQLVPDVSRTNNVAQLNLVKPNTEVQSMTWSRVASNLLAVTVSVINDGAISNGPTTISLNQDSVTGTNLFSESIGALAPGQSMDVTFLWNTVGLPDNLNIYTVLSGSGISNNFSAVNTISALVISQVLPPWIGSCQYPANGGFQIELYGTVGHAYTLLASTDLVNWIPVLNFTCTNAPMYVVDPGAKYFGWRFYRVAQGTLPVMLKLALNSPPALTTNGLGFNVQAPLGFSYVIQTSTNLKNWQPFTNFISTNSIMFFRDRDFTNYSRRFYRAVMP
jgi:hypothetical protein